VLRGFEHIGITASDLDRTIDFYCGMLGLTLVLRKTQADGSEVVFLDAGGGMLEFFGRAGVERSRDVPRTEAGIRHLTLAFDDIGETVARLAATGVPVDLEPRPASNTELLKRIAFVRDPDGIQVELVERAAGR
jgi:glyoxylase I family protein